jgi:hypothetical protein
MPAVRESLRVAVLLSSSCFEDSYGSGLGLSRQAFPADDRNDRSWGCCQMLAPTGTAAACRRFGAAAR